MSSSLVLEEKKPMEANPNALHLQSSHHIDLMKRITAYCQQYHRELNYIIDQARRRRQIVTRTNECSICDYEDEIIDLMGRLLSNLLCVSFMDTMKCLDDQQALLSDCDEQKSSEFRSSSSLAAKRPADSLDREIDEPALKRRHVQIHAEYHQYCIDKYPGFDKHIAAYRARTDTSLDAAQKIIDEIGIDAYIAQLGDADY
jgi:hypothetical protein